jgi:hypothetical protein
MLEPDYFAKKRAELGFDRVDQLAAVQAWCDTHYPGQVRVKQLHQGTLRLVTPSSTVANDLRMRQTELLNAVTFNDPVTRLQISISTLG